MRRYELEGIRIPVDHFGITIEELPLHLRPIFPELEKVAELGGELYALQMYHLEPYRESIICSKDEDVRNPFTVPTKDGRFVDFFEHPSFTALLLDAQSILLNAARMARDAREENLGKYLRLAGLGLTDRRYDEILGEYLRLRSRINFHLLPIEKERGKRVWAGYAGIDDREETREVSHDIEALRKAGERRNNEVWFTPLTDMRVDRVSVMAGSLGTEAQHLFLERKWFLPEQGIISAFNIPNEAELASKYGTRITVFSAPFNYAYNEIVQKSKPFARLSISKRGCLRFLAAHEISHDEKYDGSEQRIGFLHQTLRESYANVLGIDLSADVWDPEISTYQYETVIKGAVGYALRDCYELLVASRRTNKPYPDLGTLVDGSCYIPGNLSLLHVNVEEGAYLVKEGMIVAINEDKVRDVARRLAKEQQKLLKSGTEQDTRDHFESILPTKPLFTTQNEMSVA